MKEASFVSFFTMKRLCVCMCGHPEHPHKMCEDVTPMPAERLSEGHVGLLGEQHA